jgi:class I lanthipeptide synthase
MPAHPAAGSPQSLSGGPAGITMLHIERAASGLAGWQTAHDWLARATANGLSTGPSAGLFHGAPALAFALHAAPQPGYASARRVLDQGVSAVIQDRLAAADRRLARGERPVLAEFDLISGLTGLGAYLHRHRPDHHLMPEILRYLVRLTEPIDGLPGWWTLSPPGRTASYPQGGHGNNGMAHGITGPLSLLALTARAGVAVVGQMEAVGRICAWIDNWRQDSRGCPWWPETVSLADRQRQETSQAGPGRASWCYGTPGIARALQLAALVTAEPARQRTAETAMARCLEDPRQLGRITGRGLCHGSAGLFMTATAFAADAIAPGDLALDRAAGLLLDGPADPGAGPGFLTGAAGYALALHVLASGVPPETSWDACLLIR